MGFAVPEAGVPEIGFPEIGFAEQEVVGGEVEIGGAKVTERERGCEAEDAGFEVQGSEL